MVSVITGEPERTHQARTSSGNCEVVAVAASSLRLSINTNPCNDGTVLLESFSPQPAAGHDLIGELPFVFLVPSTTHLGLLFPLRHGQVQDGPDRDRQVSWLAHAPLSELFCDDYASNSVCSEYLPSRRQTGDIVASDVLLIISTIVSHL